MQAKKRNSKMNFAITINLIKLKLGRYAGLPPALLSFSLSSASSFLTGSYSLRDLRPLFLPFRFRVPPSQLDFSERRNNENAQKS